MAFAKLLGLYLTLETTELRRILASHFCDEDGHVHDWLTLLVQNRPENYLTIMSLLLPDTSYGMIVDALDFLSNCIEGEINKMHRVCESAKYDNNKNLADLTDRLSNDLRKLQYDLSILDEQTQAGKLIEYNHLLADANSQAAMLIKDCDGFEASAIGNGVEVINRHFKVIQALTTMADKLIEIISDRLAKKNDLAIFIKNEFFSAAKDDNRIYLSLLARDYPNYFRHIIDDQDEDGKTLLMHAVRCGSCSVADYLLGNGVDIGKVDKKENSVLHWAALVPKECWLDSENIIGDLLAERDYEVEAVMSVRNRDGLSPLALAALERSIFFHIFRWDPNCDEKNFSESFVDLCRYLYRNQIPFPCHYVALKLFLDDPKLNLTWRCGLGESALGFAVRYGSKALMKYLLESSSGQLVDLIPEYFLELLEESKISKSSKEGRSRLFNEPVHDSRYPWLFSYKLRCLLRMASANQLPKSLSENPDIRQCTALAWSGYLKNIQTVLDGYLARSGSYLCSDGCWPKKRKIISEQREQEDLIISAARDVIDCRPTATTEQLAKLAETLANAGVPDNDTPAHDAPAHNSPYSMILQLLNVFSQRLAMKIPQRVSARCEAGPSCKKIRL